eukprot:gnl/MRDRNA2_/MRDRNA2_54150_c0_seq2.p1 gnl/MRDRNA2_/MRDRNA2_54150_c0~~gnl/MRDRNA2_/MRDRNA2_54150_c0_seq2.p1  ORF type:complete len:600 (-),score=84.46 gnl/MRDRNA2_/MRDRNA2_54150_c0_seq2:345-2144(-)
MWHLWFCLMTFAAALEPSQRCDENLTHGGVCQTPKTVIHVEMAGDVVCPWSYIGLHRLQDAVKKISARNTQLEVNISYTPFILRRHLPRSGVDKMLIFKEQFGMDEPKYRELMEKVKQNADTDGRCYDFNNMQAGNSEDAHRLLLWARAWKKELQLFEAMAHAYNCDQKWLGNHDVLVKCAEEVGLAASEAALVLANQSVALNELESGLNRSRDVGVSSVPHFIIDGKQITMSGAVLAETFLELLQAKSEESAPVKTPHCEVSFVQSGLPFARLSGCDVNDFVAAGADGAAKLRELIVTHGVLIFMDQHLTPAQEVAVNKVLGWHLEGGEAINGCSNCTQFFNPWLPTQPEVLCQGHAKLHDHFGLTGQLDMTLTYSNEGFHTDGTHFQQTELPVVTSMYCHQAPARGGETIFACGRRAFASATPEVQKKARRLLVHYVYDEALGRPIMLNGIRRVGFTVYGNGTVTGHSGGRHVVHPLIRKHPDTGEESVYISCANIDYMEASATETESAIYLDTEASYDLVETLIGGVTSPPLVHAHKWIDREFVIWDHRLSIHAPGEPPEIGQRLHHRVRLPGSDFANRDLRQHAPKIQGSDSCPL